MTPRPVRSLRHVPVTATCFSPYLVFKGDASGRSLVGCFDSHQAAADFASAWHAADGGHYWAIPRHVAAREGLI